MSYERVTPRDVFNESKLLKCLGQLSLIVCNGIDNNGYMLPAGFREEFDGKPFEIDVDRSNGGHYCKNLTFYAGPVRLDLHTARNSREPYPLIFESDLQGPMEVFNDRGALMADFVKEIERLSAISNTELIEE